MAYYFSRKLKIPFDETIQKITSNLQQQGFENIREIDVTHMLKEKYGITFRRYRIMSAFHPDFAYKAISLESHIGLLLPCNIVVQEHENGEVEISATSASETMDKLTATPQLTGIVGDLAHRLRTAIDDLHRVMPEPHHPEALPEDDAEHGRPANMLG